MPYCSVYEMQIETGSPAPLGARYDGSGVNFAIYSEHAERVYLCLFSSPDSLYESLCIPLKWRTGDVWHAYVHGLTPGQLYGYRVMGPFTPEEGHLFNPAKVLFDPYAKAVGRDLKWHASLYGFQYPDQYLKMDTTDSVEYAPLGQVIDTSYDWEGDEHLRIPFKDSIIYELHVKGFTKNLKTIPAELRGTYAGLASDPSIAFLKDLGVTAVELLPVHHSVAEHILDQKGLTNYWGYNTLAYFAPCSRYAATSDAVREFKDMVKRLHKAGLEVILDVVYNHTAETDHTGPTFCFRGIDNKGYYRLDPDDMTRYQDFTGCGNTLNMLNPYVLKLIMDSLRYWVSEMHVDGFRFDLASALARELFEVDRLGSFFDIIAQDPVLSQVKLIAEPWDLGEGGYMVGGFPTGWSEWNGQYRDGVRRFWNTKEATTAQFVTRIAGSSDLYRKEQRRPTASINYIVSHDGFTMADLVMYNEKHNDANPWNNTDGANDNYSNNMGVEGPTDDPEINRRRLRRHLNLLVTLFTSQGVPMLLAGDERGRSQGGNNNAYCQDNDINYLDWEFDDHAKKLVDTANKLIQIRRTNNVLRRNDFFIGDIESGLDLKDVYWLNARGEELSVEEWERPAGPVGMLLPAHFGTRPDLYESVGGNSIYVFFNPTEEPIRFRIPTVILANWDTVVRTDDLVVSEIMESGSMMELEPDSSVVLIAHPGWKKESIERQKERSAFGRLINLAGIERSFTDMTGHTTNLNGYQLLEMLEQALPEMVGNPSFLEVAETIEKEELTRLLAPMMVVQGSTNRFIKIWLPAKIRNDCTLQINSQAGEWKTEWQISADSVVEDRKIISKNDTLPEWFMHVPWPADNLLPVVLLKVAVPELPMGYYRLSLRYEDNLLAESGLAVCPERCYLPQGHRKFGVTIQLYSLRSKESEGIGDFYDLIRLGHVLFDSGYRVLGISPVHATGFSNPSNRSPYYPSSRILVNPAYISAGALPESEKAGAGPFIEQLKELNEKPDVDYEIVYTLKKNALKKVYEYVKSAGMPDGFEEFRNRRPEAQVQAVFDAADEIYGPGEAPFSLTDKTSDNYIEFCNSHASLLEFYEFAYYLAEKQFEEARYALSETGMSLYVDLAVGTSPSGTDAAGYQDLIAGSARAGAPPDQFAPQGQNWGLAVWPPYTLKKTGYQPYIEMIRANMLTDGYLRIDHAMWLFRLFWISENAQTYVNYPSQDLIALLCLESHLHRCQIIGEDLGTVPHHVREELHKRAIYSWKVLYFERQPDGDFVDPSLFPHVSITTINTHDLPTIEGYLQASDSEARLKAGLITEEQHANAVRARSDEIRHLKSSLGAMGIDTSAIPDMEPGSITLSEDQKTDRIVLMSRLLFRSRSGLVLISLGDLLGELMQPNLPGTIDEYPCWKLRHAVNIEDLNKHPVYEAVRQLIPVR